MQFIYHDIAYVFLYLTVMSLWVPDIKGKPCWPFLLSISMALGIITQRIELIALLPIALLIIAIYLFKAKSNRFLQRLCGTIIALIGVGLGAHLFPGFNNLIVIQKVFISADAIPYSMGLNFDKTIVGILLLGMLHNRIHQSKEWLALIKQILFPTIIIVLSLIVIAMSIGFIRFEPKLSPLLPIWFITNLLFVCTAEEAFFRGFIQKNLMRAFIKFKNSHYFAILITATLFGIAHYAGGIKYVILAGLAGIGYGWVYYRCKRIEGSIFTHFSLNLTHFLFFTYPMLKLCA